MKKELPVRKHLRLKGYDYSRNGLYFLTFCVKDGHEMLGNAVGRDALGAPCTRLSEHAGKRGIPDMPPYPYIELDAPSYIQLSEYGKIIHKEIEETHLYYKNVIIDKFVVMPNHVHLIVSIQNEDGNGAPGASRPTNALVPNIVGILKRKTNKLYGFDMWHVSYHDRIIRDEAEYHTKWRYIDENPVRWAEDEYYKK